MATIREMLIDVRIKKLLALLRKIYLAAREARKRSLFIGLNYTLRINSTKPNIA